MKKRLLYYQLIKQIEHKNALVITGMRQVGKTTLMRQIFDELPKDKAKLWFDFENPFDQKIFEDIEYRNIYQRLREDSQAKQDQRIYVFIDEIQSFPEITKIIKYLIDHYQVKFLLTGSSSFYLKNLFPESLSGRKFLYHLQPLNFKEYLYFLDKIELKTAKIKVIQKAVEPIHAIEFKRFESDYQNFLEFGGFPEVVVTANKETKGQVLKNIFQSFFEKDLRILSDYKDIKDLRDLLLLLVPRVGSMIDVSKIASELGVDRPKIYHFLEFLQGTFMIQLLPKFSRSLDRSVAGGRKVYFTDNGLLNAIGKVNDAQLLENSVINQLAYYGEISFYNKKNTSEIDLILDKEIAFEIKLNGTDEDCWKLEKLSANLGVKTNFVISKNFNNKKNFLSPIQL
ncbi:MAG: hypothetical protein ACD_83C00149G0002 [uncultured bacterium]|uniref:ATPase n=1 Tax=Berkelbacteria bacterium GW2011_GWA2_38_9 TaxID=1618334 RepID=A0A0G0LBA4_9BACT|nr:MAG: hypothetical protein ACD_83C00149G0002 [uncultured bacterium]KKQ88282.1 MAG: ATPase [Berkelbacteria bacterium GW2011_GWA2_38_9]